MPFKIRKLIENIEAIYVIICFCGYLGFGLMFIYSKIMTFTYFCIAFMASIIFWPFLFNISNYLIQKHYQPQNKIN